MPIIKNGHLRRAIVLGSVALLTSALGVAVSAYMGSLGQSAGQGPGGPVGPPPGMMGQGPGGPGGPGGRGLGPGGPGGGMFGMLGPELQAVALTDAQKKQVQTVLESFQADQAAIRDRMQPARKGLNDAIAADAFDEAVIRTKAADLAAVEADSAVLQAKVRAAVHALLTPEQLQKIKELRAKMPTGPRQGPGRIEQQESEQEAPHDTGPSLPETV
jgi:Spy/CpxP family protein refolding chaperone